MAIPIQNFPPLAFLLPVAAFDSIIGNTAVFCMYQKSHVCPCVGNTGSPNPNSVSCTVCLGRGIYWDPPTGPFGVLLTLISWLGRNVDMGETVDADYGMIDRGHPIITIPHTQQPIWTVANTNDIFIQSEAIMRFQSVLRVGENETVPAWQILQLSSVTIAPTGAVVVEDPTTNQPVNTGFTYTVNGGTVTLDPNSTYTPWPDGTSYTVEYYAPLSLVLQEPFGGRPHIRVFENLSYPRRFKTSVLDLWLRDTLGSSTDLRAGP
jgi:hypothetical protein